MIFFFTPVSTGEQPGHLLRHESGARCRLDVQFDRGEDEKRNSPYVQRCISPDSQLRWWFWGSGMRKARSRCLFVDCTDTVAGAAMRKRQAGPLDRSPRRRDVHLSRNRDEIRASSQFLQTLFSITSSDTELKVSEKNSKVQLIQLNTRKRKRTKMRFEETETDGLGCRTPTACLTWRPAKTGVRRGGRGRPRWAAPIQTVHMAFDAKKSRRASGSVSIKRNRSGVVTSQHRSRWNTFSAMWKRSK